jgi:Ca2+/Na+ antiporter
LVVTRLCFLEPSVASLKSRLVLRPQIRDWFIHIVSKSGPDLLLSSIIIFRGEDSKAIGKTHGGILSALLLLPGISRLILPDVLPLKRPRSPRLTLSIIGLISCSVALAWILLDRSVSLHEAFTLLSLFAAFQALGIFVAFARPDPVETEMLVFQQSRALGAVGVLLLPPMPDNVHGVSEHKFPGRRLLGCVMFSASVGSPLESLAPAAVAIAFFWVFVFSLCLDEVTSQLAEHFGVSDQLVGLTFVALGTKMPKLISAFLQRHVISVSPDSLDSLTFSTSATLAIPWIFRGGRSVPVSAVNLLGCGLSVLALVIAVVCRELPGRRVGGMLCGGWLLTQTAYLWWMIDDS